MNSDDLRIIHIWHLCISFDVTLRLLRVSKWNRNSKWYNIDQKTKCKTIILHKLIFRNFIQIYKISWSHIHSDWKRYQNTVFSCATRFFYYLMYLHENHISLFRIQYGKHTLLKQHLYKYTTIPVLFKVIQFNKILHISLLPTVEYTL